MVVCLSPLLGKEQITGAVSLPKGIQLQKSIPQNKIASHYCRLNFMNYIFVDKM